MKTITINNVYSKKIKEQHGGLMDITLEGMDKEQDVKQFMEASDGYHTFEELYNFRKIYNAALFNSLYKADLYDCHKSKRHFDGEECFGGGWFIVVAMLPGGQISNHYEVKDWDLFNIPETEKALFEFDGHTTGDVLERLKTV